MKLRDRVSAGEQLAESLRNDILLKEEVRRACLVLGIPRGGVVVADVIAKNLSCDFDTIVARKLRSPYDEELAIGAIMEDGTTYLNEVIVKNLNISPNILKWKNHGN